MDTALLQACVCAEAVVLEFDQPFLTVEGLPEHGEGHVLTFFVPSAYWNSLSITHLGKLPEPECTHDFF